MKRKKRKRDPTIRSPDEQERYDRTTKVLLERIAFHRARIEARERGEDPDAATA